MRTTILLSACLALFASTTGLLLAIHISNAERSTDHDSHDCSVCRQLLIASKKISVAPGIELMCEPAALCGDAREFTEHIEARYPPVVRLQGPPAHTSTSRFDGGFSHAARRADSL